MAKQIGSSTKEKELPSSAEEKLLEEAEAKAEIEARLKPYIQVEEEPQIPNGLKAHMHSPTQAASQVVQAGPTITLPLTEEEIKKGLHHKILDSILWLATFCVKKIKEASVHGVKVFFRKGNSQTI